MARRTTPKITSSGFRFIGGVLRERRAPPNVVEGFASALKQTNPLFDADRFIRFVRTGKDTRRKR